MLPLHRRLSSCELAARTGVVSGCERMQLQRHSCVILASLLLTPAAPAPEHSNAIAAACGASSSGDGEDSEGEGGAPPGPAPSSAPPDDESLAGGGDDSEEEGGASLDPPASTSAGSPGPEEVAGPNNYTTGPLPDGTVRISMAYSPPVRCSKWDTDARGFVRDLTTYYGATGTAMPPASDIKVGG